MAFIEPMHHNKPNITYLPFKTEEEWLTHTIDSLLKRLDAIVSLETMAYYDIAHKSMLGWYVCLIHDFVTHLPQHTRSSSINQVTMGLQGIQPAYPPCIPTLPKHSSEARACTRATGWAPPIWYSEILHNTEYQLVANPLDWDYIVLLGCHK